MKKNNKVTKKAYTGPLTKDMTSKRADAGKKVKQDPTPRDHSMDPRRARY